jgi:hypothetical protein
MSLELTQSLPHFEERVTIGTRCNEASGLSWIDYVDCEGARGGGADVEGKETPALLLLRIPIYVSPCASASLCPSPSPCVAQHPPPDLSPVYLPLPSNMPCTFLSPSLHDALLQHHVDRGVTSQKHLLGVSEAGKPLTLSHGCISCGSTRPHRHARSSSRSSSFQASSTRTRRL